MKTTTRFRCIAAVLLSILLATPVWAGEAQLVKLDNGIVKDTKTGLMWQFDRSHHPVASSEEASEYVGKLDLGGYHDWRLPTLAERWSLVQIFVFKDNGGIKFPSFGSKYWTTETDKGTQPINLDSSCMCMNLQEVAYKKDGYVRAVRGGKTR